VDSTQTFTLAGSTGTLTFRQMNLMPGATPAKLAVTGDVNINPLNGATATISKGAGSGSSGSVDLNGGVRGFNIGNGAASVDFDVAVPIANGGIIKSGAGTMRLSGNNTLGAVSVNAGSLLCNGVSTTGAVTVNGGTLGGTGSVTGTVTVNSGGHLAPGAGVGAIAVGGLTLNAGSILDFEFGPAGAVDLVNVSAALTLNASSLNLINLGGMSPGTYTLINYSTLSGGLTNLTAPTGPSSFSYRVFDTGSAIDLQVSIAGDFNSDGVVDAADYVVWRAGLGTIYTQADFDTWRAHFGQTVVSGSGLAEREAVPEPSWVALLSSGLLVMVLRYRGRKSMWRTS
jgi:autotransporter-associated beta strand protein